MRSIRPTNIRCACRVHCPENERALAIYRSFGDSGAITCGGQSILSPGKLQLEIQEFVNGVGGTPVTLYDGAIANLPGSVHGGGGQQHQPDRNHARHQPDQSWLGLGGEHASERRALYAAGGHNGRSGRVPPGAHRQGGVLHRVCAGGRRADCGELPHDGQGGGASGEYRQPAGADCRPGSPAVAAWIGSVTNPPARSSADCRNAALAMEQAAAGVSALWSGTYKGNRTSFASRCLAGRCAAAECAFDQSECAGGGADGEGELSRQLS